MHLNQENVYYGFINNNINTYFFKEYNGSNRSNVLTYESNKNYFVNGELSTYNPNNNIVLPSTNNIYMEIPKDWKECYYYVWGNEGEKVNWPGEPCEKLSDKIYYFEKNDKYQNFIFNCGPNTSDISRTQTPDLNENQILGYNNPLYNLETETFSELTDTLPTICSKKTIFINRPLNFVNTYLCYQYNNQTISIKLENIIDNIFGITCYIPESITNIYFSNGSSLRTLDLALNEEFNYYNANGEWLYLQNTSAPESDILPELPDNPISPNNQRSQIHLFKVLIKMKLRFIMNYLI